MRLFTSFHPEDETTVTQIFDNFPPRFFELFSNSGADWAFNGDIKLSVSEYASLCQLSIFFLTESYLTSDLMKTELDPFLELESEVEASLVHIILLERLDVPDIISGKILLDASSMLPVEISNHLASLLYDLKRPFDYYSGHRDRENREVLEAGSVLFLGDLPPASAKSCVRSSNRTWTTKLFRSSSSNWETISDLIGEHSSDGFNHVILKLDENTLWASTEEEYAPIFNEILLKLEKTNHLFLIYEPLLSGRFTWLQGHAPISVLSECRSTVNDILHRKLNIVVYQSTGEYESAIYDFLSNADEHIILRLYVPDERLWGKQIDQWLALFKEYLDKITDIPVKLTHSRTRNGVSYTFAATEREHVDRDKWGSYVSDFNTFLENCASNPETAVQLLSQYRIEPSRGREIVSRYAREARRMAIDLEFERRKAVNSMQHDLMSELLDLADLNSLEELATDVTNQLLPAPGTRPGPENVLAMKNYFTTPTVKFNVHIGDVNNTNIQNKVEKVLQNTFSGRITYNENDYRIFELIDNYSTGLDAAELRSALEELKDSTAPTDERQSAWSKIHVFLSKHSDKIQGFGLKVLFEYLDHTMKS